MLSGLRTALRVLLRRSQIERELEEELRQHIERQTEQNIRLGMSQVEARFAALKNFGGLELSKEKSRDSRGVRWIEELWQDLRYKLVIGWGMKLTLIGVAIGLVASVMLAQMMENLLFGMNEADPLTFALIVLLLSMVGLLACWIPARRATKVDPMTALRCE
jgi:ABC-type sugar transport system permease subunit